MNFLDRILQSPPSKKSEKTPPKQKTKEKPATARHKEGPSKPAPKKPEPGNPEFQIHQRVRDAIFRKRPGIKGIIGKAISKLKIIGSGYVSDKTRVSYARINNPDLARSDRNLVLAYLALKAIGYDSKAEEIRREIVDVYAARKSCLMMNYDGRLSFENAVTAREIYALEYVIADQGLMTEEEGASVERAASAPFLDQDDMRLLSAYEGVKKALSASDNMAEAAGLSKAFGRIEAQILNRMTEAAGLPKAVENLEAQILSRAVFYNELKETLLVDDAERGGLMRNALAFNQVAVSMGAPVSELKTDPMMFLPEYSEIETMGKAAQTPEKIDDARYVPLAVGRCKLMYREYLEAISSGSIDPAGAAFLQRKAMMYFGAAADLGVSNKELDLVVSELNAEFSGKVAFSGLSFDGMRRDGQAYVIRPDMLPDRIKEHLSSIQKEPGLNYLQWVEKNVKFLVVSPTLVSDLDVVGDQQAGGWTDRHLPVVNLDIFDEYSGKLRTDAEIAATLVHETDHVEYMDRYSADALARQSAFTECHAYFEGYRFASRLHDRLIKLGAGKDEIARLEGHIRTEKALYEGSLEIIGVIPPDEGVDVAYMVSHADPELDYDIYPTQTINAQTKIMTTTLSFAAGLTREDEERLASMIRNIFSKKGSQVERTAENDRIITKLISSIYPQYSGKSLDESVRLVKKDGYAAAYVRDLNRQLIVLVQNKMEDLYASGTEFSDSDREVYRAVRWAWNGGMAGLRTRDDQLKLLDYLLKCSVKYGVKEKKEADELLRKAANPDRSVLQEAMNADPSQFGPEMDMTFLSILNDKAIR